MTTLRAQLCLALLYLGILGINQLIMPDDHSCISNNNESIKHQILKYCQRKHIRFLSCSRISAISNMHMSLVNF